MDVHNEFSNYYAYDDGAAESAVYLNTLNAQLAEKFTLNVGDTLQCVDIYFYPMGSNATLYSFSLNVWNDNGGIPGTAIYTSASVLTPEYDTTGINKFIRYCLDAPLYLSASTFYIGFTQITDQELNVGEDKNNNTMDKVFYNVGSGWENAYSTLSGSLMMRPILGTKAGLVDIDNHTAKNVSSISVYPNPANDIINIQIVSPNPKGSNVQINIYNVMGEKVYEEAPTLNGDNIFPITLPLGLGQGVYFIRITEGENSLTTKFVKIN